MKPSETLPLILLGLVAGVLAVCDGKPPPPPPPPPPTTTTTAPDLERKPEDYITLERAKRIINDVEVDSRSDIWLSIWSGVRDEEYAAAHCAGIVEDVLGMSVDQLNEMAAEGRELIRQWEGHWHTNLSTVNWRCESDARFCGRSNVLKSRWAPYLDRLREHRGQANLNREIAQRDPLAKCLFDTVQGWCQCRNGDI